MALTGYLEVPEELLILFRQLVRVNDAQRYGSVAKQGYVPNPAQKLKVTTKSLLPEIATLWAGLTTEQQNAWKSAGSQTNMNGWNLFVQDTAYRIKFGVSGLAVPSDYHQYKVGKLEINSPANGALLAQYHPAFYYKLQKVPGTKALYNDVKITESLTLPLETGLSFACDMVPFGDDPVARFYAEITSSYQGRNILTEVGFDIPLQTGWTRETVTATEVLGVVRSYNLWLEFNNVRGEFWWDNVLAHHTGTNYARDFRCIDVNNELTRINYMIEKSWEEEFLPNGSAFGSVYFP